MLDPVILATAFQPLGDIMIEMQIIAFLFLSMIGAGGAIMGFGMVRASYATVRKAKRRARLGHPKRPLVRLSDVENELDHVEASKRYFGLK